MVILYVLLYSTRDIVEKIILVTVNRFVLFVFVCTHPMDPWMVCSRSKRAQNVRMSPLLTPNVLAGSGFLTIK